MNKKQKHIFGIPKKLTIHNYSLIDRINMTALCIGTSGRIPGIIKVYEGTAKRIPSILDLYSITNFENNENSHTIFSFRGDLYADELFDLNIGNDDIIIFGERNK